jgi:DNA-binding GntR family transcriptional regulator
MMLRRKALARGLRLLDMVRDGSRWFALVSRSLFLARAELTGTRLQIVRGGRMTLADELHLQLADEIVRGALAPGAALDEAGLAERFQVSRTPVREAIRQLAASRLIETRPHRSSVVARPNAGQLTGMFEVMAELEGLCAGLAAERMSGKERRTLATWHERLRMLMQEGNPQRYLEINEAFHATVYSGAHNEYLVDITVATRRRVQPFRRAQFRNLGRLAKSHAEQTGSYCNHARRPRRRSGGNARPHHDGSGRIRYLRRIDAPTAAGQAAGHRT